MEQFYFSLLLCRCRCRTRLYAFSDFICSLSLSHFSYFEKRAENLKIPVLFLSFVDNRLFIFQEKSLEKTNLHIFCSYNIISLLLKHFILVIKYGKSGVFHFSRLHGVFNPSFQRSYLQTQRHLEISRFHLWQEIIILTTYQVLFQQSIVNCQVYENTWKFHLKSSPSVKRTALQNLHITDYAL